MLAALFVYVYCLVVGIVYFILRVTIYKDNDDSDDALMIAVGWPVTLALCAIYIPFLVIEKAAVKANEAMDLIKERKKRSARKLRKAIKKNTKIYKRYVRRSKLRKIEKRMQLSAFRLGILR